MEFDVSALQMLTGDDPVALGDCFVTCGWSDGNICSITNPCGVTNPCAFTTNSPCFFTGK
ncbi:ALQxL family class IV lanthipeptide [Streptomyces sp. P1-3]|uniref:ALQxL family class IV lanthipeptide n=1 Tax=Streptomyces sp. P1-3 TaxID=3421658 RepID=UPI003D367274